ncbi:hypothetical protein FRC10_001022 [Ceratobasidium sp. 414]|nr:hypothetical protein FRC10_001022 [Ceratobasidium sp. 414]
MTSHQVFRGVRLTLSLDEGGLTSLLKSVGQAVPLAELKGLQATEQTKKQKGIASAHGNATQPSPLPPLPKRCKPDNDGPLTNCWYGSLTSKEDQIKWLCQAIEAFGDLTNYRNNPKFQDPAVLYKVYKDLCDSERANDPLPPTSKAGNEALCRESNAHGKETKGPASGPSPSAHDPQDSPKGAPSTKARMVHAVSPEVEECEYNEDMDDNMEEGEVSKAVAPAEDDKGSDGENSKQGNSRARQHLVSFSPATPVVERVVQKVQVEMAVVCGFLEFVKSMEDPTSTYFDLWIPRLWAKANNELQPNQPHFELEDRHIQRQLAPIRTSIKKCAEPMMESYFGLDHSEPDHIEKSHHLTGEEKWLSPTLKNDKKMFQHKIIGNTIAHAFFHSGRGISVKHRDQFTPLIPIATIAYVCAIIRHLVKLYEFDNPKAANLKADEDADTYHYYMRMLHKIAQENQGALTNIRSKITL